MEAAEEDINMTEPKQGVVYSVTNGRRVMTQL
jgi:hypothetical protein